MSSQDKQPAQAFQPIDPDSTTAEKSQNSIQQAVPQDADTATAHDTTIDSDEELGKPQKVDGGIAAWSVVLGAWCVSFCSYGWINSVGIFQQYYQDGPLSEYSASTIAWIPALQICFISAFGPLFGTIFDRHGPRVIMAVGSFMHVFGLMMASISSQYYQFILSQGVCSSLGVSAIFTAAISSVAGWFDRRRGLAFGILATGSSVGGVVLPIMLTRLIDHVGYGWSMRTVAFIMLALLIVANLTVRRRSSIPMQKTVSRGFLGRPFRELPFIFLLVGLALVPFGLYTPIDFLPTVAVSTGTPLELAQNLVPIYNAGSLFGRLGSGFLADRLGRFNVFIMACYIAGILVLAMWIPAANEATTIAFTLLFGLFSGAYVALVAALVAQISPIEEIGYRNGVGSLAQAIGGLASTPIAGAIMQRPNGSLGVKAYAGAFLVAGTTGILFARIARTGWKIKVVL